MTAAAPLARLMLSRSDLDRSAAERVDPTLLSRLRADPSTRVLQLRDGRAPVLGYRVAGAGEGCATLALLDAARLPSPLPGDGLWLFLGRDDEGVGYLAHVPPGDPPDAHPPIDVAVPQSEWLGLREVGERLGDRDAGLFVTALALANWHATHTHCPRCGVRTEPALGGWTRRCPADASEHYPRTDPAIIVTTIDPDDRVLLGHNPAWPKGRFSTLAGFIEPGECLEDAVRREVFEESGVVVGDVTYLGSQPWPFPASLMLGCTARATSTTITVDGSEVSEARWFTRDQLAGAITSGEVVPPSGVSIARRLVERWFGGTLPVGRQRW
jgi:NAD+ diphosphatase